MTLSEAMEKLQRNESRMTAEQKREYAPRLNVRRARARQMAKSEGTAFILSGVWLQRDGREVLSTIQGILESEKRTLNAAMRTLFETYSVDAFLEVLCPLQRRVFYEGYGPYWAGHCKAVSDGDSDAAFSYYNDIIGMYWCEEWRLWKRKGEWTVAIMLPPTIEQIRADYERAKVESV